MAVKVRLYPSAEQEPALVEHCAHARFVYNIGLEQRSLWRPGLRAPSVYDQKKQLTQARAEFEWLAAGASVVQQQALFDLDRAFQNFFAKRASYPRFRRKGVDEGFVIRDLKITRLSRRWGSVLVPKVGMVKFRAHRDWGLLTDASSARVTYRSGRWHVAFTTPAPPQTVAGTGAVAGIDRGVANTLATSDGTFAHIPGLTPGEQTRFLALERQLARQTKGSTGRARTKSKMSRLRARLTDRRTDWVEQTTTALARTYDLISLEWLNTAGMVRRPKPRPDPDQAGAYLPNGARAKAALNRAIYASCWGAFERRLVDKMGDRVVFVDSRNTSRQCRACGHVAAENRESQAVFCCVACGHSGHADTQAALNILDRAFAGSTLDHLPVVEFDSTARGRRVDGRDCGLSTTASTTRLAVS